MWQPSSVEQLCRRVRDYCTFNSYTFNVEGVARAAGMAAGELRELGGEVGVFSVEAAEVVGRDGTIERAPIGPGVRAVFNGGSARRVLLSIHLDTVYPVEHWFREVSREGERLHGPGVADAKGGLVVLLEGLGRYLACGGKTGVEVVLNPDEEIGSPSSRGVLVESAGRCVGGLVFEPTYPDGAMVSRRKGSGTYTVVVRGRSAHAGRDFEKGRNALVAAAEVAVGLAGLNGTMGGATVNCGVMEAGSAANVVPDRAVLRVNVRVETGGEVAELDAAIRAVAAGVSRREGIAVEVHGGVASMPRPGDGVCGELLAKVLDVAGSLGLPTASRPSGGTCDGNKLAAAGLAVADSMGPTGGELHSPREYLDIASLESRAELLCRVLGRL